MASMDWAKTTARPDGKHFKFGDLVHLYQKIDGMLQIGCLHVCLPAITHEWLANIGSANGVVPSGNKPLAEPMLTQIHVAMQHH